MRMWFIPILILTTLLVTILSQSVIRVQAMIRFQCHIQSQRKQKKHTYYVISVKLFDILFEVELD